MTDVGVIPEDWEVKSIGDICVVKDGTHQTPNYTYFGIPFYSVENISNNDFSNVKYISEEEHIILSSNSKIEKGDVLMTRIGSIGCCKYIDWEVKASFYVSLALLKFQDDECARYFTHYSETNLFKDEIEQNSLQFAVPQKINLGNIPKIRIILPSILKEQQVIADALTKVDNLITSLTKVIEKKKLIKKGTMQKLLSGEMRLDGFEGEFATKTFSDFIERFATGLNPRDNFELNKGGNNYYVTIKNFINGKLFLDDNCDKITDEAKDIIDKRSSLKVGDVLFSSIGRIGDAYVINENPTNWNINESVFSLRPNPTIMDSYFLYYLIMSDSVQKKFDDAISGSTLKSIKLNDLREIECTYPQNIDEQTAIAKVLTTMDDEIEALEKERDKYKCIKQGMMQQLLTGKIRLICQ